MNMNNEGNEFSGVRSDDTQRYGKLLNTFAISDFMERQQNSRLESPSSQVKQSLDTEDIKAFYSRFFEHGDVQRQRNPGLPNQVGTVRAEGLAPESASRPLTDTDMKGKSPAELVVMENELYARHGMHFNDPQLQQYFKNQSWYHDTGKTMQQSKDEMTEAEKKNIDIINQYMGDHKIDPRQTEVPANTGVHPSKPGASPVDDGAAAAKKPKDTNSDENSASLEARAAKAENKKDYNNAANLYQQAMVQALHEFGHEPGRAGELGQGSSPTKAWLHAKEEYEKQLSRLCQETADAYGKAGNTTDAAIYKKMAAYYSDPNGDRSQNPVDLYLIYKQESSPVKGI